MNGRKTAALLVVVLGVVFAGCSAGPIGSSGPTATEVRDDAVAAMTDVETYRVRADENRSVEGTLSQQLDVEVVKAVDRPARKLRANQTTTVGGQTVETKVYIVDQTVYRHSPVFVRQYDSEWIKADASENFSLVWQTQDTLERHERVLNVSDVQLDGTETVNGTETRVLEADPRPDELERVLAELYGGAAGNLNENDVNVSDAHYTVYVSTATDRPVRIEGSLNTTISNVGQSVDVTQSFVFTYDRYGVDVSVTLPAGAEDAVDVGRGRVAPIDGSSPRIPAH